MICSWVSSKSLSVTGIRKSEFTRSVSRYTFSSATMAGSCAPFIFPPIWETPGRPWTDESPVVLLIREVPGIIKFSVAFSSTFFDELMCMLLADWLPSRMLRCCEISAFDPIWIGKEPADPCPSWASYSCDWEASVMASRRFLRLSSSSISMLAFSWSWRINFAMLPLPSSHSSY